MRQRHHLVGKVMRALGALRMSNGDERLLEQLLQIGLPHVDDVVDVRRAAEWRMLAHPVLTDRGPERSVSTIRKHPVLEVAPEQPELPELIRDVLADIGDHAIRTDDDLLPLVTFLVWLFSFD